MAGDSPHAHLVEALRAERRRRWQQGDRVLAETYLRQHPALQADATHAVELIYHEILLREELGEAPQAEEYLRRFPRYAAELGPLFEVHRAIEAGWLLETPHPSASSSSPLSGKEDGGDRPLPGVPGYEVLERLGQGAAGVVYRARHLRLGRLVALKMLRSGTHAGKQELARFRAEAELQARLQHAHIVQIFEVGEADGCPYFALEYVSGGSLEGRLTGTPQPARVSAGLVETLARAIDHAHRRGLVHRDLKPANILLTADGVPKVSDFGLARPLQGPGLQTQSGTIVGTASYMAPEQAAGRTKAVGPAADVYALGAILYDLLTGRPPFLGETTFDTLLQVRSQEPVPVRRLQPKVPRDLETICHHCLHKESAKRYATAAALADDLRRFLDGQPILARPVGWWGRGLKWAKRRPALVATGGVALTLAVAAWVVSTVLIVREKARTEETLRVALRAMDQIVLGGLEKWLPQETDPGLERREVLQQTLQFYEQFIREHRNNPALRHELGRAHRRVGNIYHLLGQFGPAETAYRQAIAFLEELAAAFPAQPAFRQELALCYYHLALMLATSAPLPAEDYFRRAAAVQEQLVAEFPDVPDYRADLGRTYRALGALLPIDRAAEGADLIRKALRLLEQVAAEEPEQPDHRYFQALSHVSLGVQLQPHGESAAAYRRAVALLQPLVTEFPRRSEYREILATAYSSLGNALASRRQWEPAGQAFHESCRVGEQLVADFPRVPRFHQRLANSLTNLGYLWQRIHRPAEAETAYRQSLKHWDEVQRLVDDFPRLAGPRYELGVVLNNLGDLLRQRGDAAAARPLLEQSVRHHRATLESNPQNPSYRGAFCQRLQTLAETLVQLGDDTAAAAVIEELVQALPDDWSDSYYAAVCLARCAARAESAAGLTDGPRRAQAAAYGGRARDLVREAVRRGADNPAALNEVAWGLAVSPEPHLRDAPQAVALARQAVDRAPQKGNYWNTLGVAYVRVGDWPAALAALKQSVELRPGGGDSFDWFFLAMACWHLGEKDEARCWYARAVAWMGHNKPDDDDLRRFAAEAATLLGLPEPPTATPAEAPVR